MHQALGADAQNSGHHKQEMQTEKAEIEYFRSGLGMRRSTRNKLRTYDLGFSYGDILRLESEE